MSDPNKWMTLVTPEQPKRSNQKWTADEEDYLKSLVEGTYEVKRIRNVEERLRAADYDLLAEQLNCARQPVDKGDPCAPAQTFHLTNIKLFLWGSIRLAAVPANTAVESSGSCNCLGKFADAEVHACTHVKEGQLIGPGLPVFKSKYASFAQVISV